MNYDLPSVKFKLKKMCQIITVIKKTHILFSMHLFKLDIITSSLHCIIKKNGDLIFSQEKIKIEEERGKKWKIKYQNLEGKISTGIS